MASQFVMTYKFGFFGEELIEILGLDRELVVSSQVAASSNEESADINSENLGFQLMQTDYA
uniref:Uncharacterized protein n=1 Tax=Solanum lycopersicum TaxID=4081 RepID=A0A3Q7JLF1_SOLLC